MNKTSALGNLSLIWKVLAVLFVFQSFVIGFYAFISQQELDERLIKENLAVKAASQSYFNRAVESHIYAIQDNIYRAVDLQTLQQVNNPQPHSFWQHHWRNLSADFEALSLSVYQQQKLVFEQRHHVEQLQHYSIASYIAEAVASSTPIHFLTCHTVCTINIFIPVMLSGTELVVHITTSLFNPILQFREILNLKTLIISNAAPQAQISSALIFEGKSGDISLDVMRLENNAEQFKAIRQYALHNSFEDLIQRGGRIDMENSHYFIDAIKLPFEAFSTSYLVTFNDITNTYQLDKQFYKSFILLSLGTLLTLFLVILTVLWRPITRIKKLRNYLPTLAKGEEIKPLPINDNSYFFHDEIDVLEHTSNELAIRLKELNKVVNQREEELKEMALYDSLTHIANRESFILKLRQSIREVEHQESAIALLFIDLDRFKQINDTLGHHFGDEVLKVVAKRLQSSVRASDLVARLGGDEFTILLTKVNSKTNIIKVVDDIFKKFEAPAHIEELQLAIHLSIGITIIRDNKTSVNEVIKQADIAMYSAKSDRNMRYVFFQPHMESEVSTQFSLLNEFKNAIHQHQFKLYFQPFYHIENNQLFGFETLIRWQHPERGLLAPDVFLPIIKDTDYMSTLENWIIEEGIKRCKQLNSINHSTIVCAINISAEKYMSADLADRLKQLLIQYELDSHCLYIEIVEESIVHDIDEAIKRSIELRALGIKVSIDDFGVGYSSLNYLRRLPANNVKIDRSFVSEIPEQESSKKVLSALISLLKSMNKTVTAEGVENIEQLQWLQTQGCHIGQGYLFSKPVPLEEAISITISEGDKYQPTPIENYL